MIETHSLTAELAAAAGESGSEQGWCAGRSEAELY